MIEKIRTVTARFYGYYPQDGGHPFSRDSEAWRCADCGKIWLKEKLANQHHCKGDLDELQVQSQTTPA